MSMLYVHQDNPNTQLILASTHYTIPILGTNAVLFSAKCVTLGALRGLKETTWPMAIELFSSWIVGFPLGVILVYCGNLGAIGVAIGDCTGSLTGWLLLSFYFSRIFHSIESQYRTLEQRGHNEHSLSLEQSDTIIVGGDIDRAIYSPLSTEKNSFSNNKRIMPLLKSFSVFNTEEVLPQDDTTKDFVVSSTHDRK